MKALEYLGHAGLVICLLPFMFFGALWMFGRFGFIAGCETCKLFLMEYFD